LADPRENGGIYSSSAYFLELLPSVLDSLRQEGLLNQFVSKENGTLLKSQPDSSLLIFNFNKLKLFPWPFSNVGENSPTEGPLEGVESLGVNEDDEVRPEIHGEPTQG